MQIFNKYFFAYSLILVLLNNLSGQSNSNNLQDSYQLVIKKTSEEIKIDGELSESVWADADVATEFWVSFPVDDKRADQSIQTEVRVTYDETYIYISAICKGMGPYVVQSLKRDNPTFWRGDAFAVVFDPVNERTNGFSFGTNPEGVQTESLITGQTGRRGSDSGSSGMNGAWDNKWYTNVKKGEDQWTLEMAIPFKTLRYGDKKIWGINFVRGEMKTNSYHTWSPVPVQFRGVDLGYTGAMIWDESPAKTKKNISVIPYVLGSGVHNQEEGEPKELDGRIGLDAKFAVTSGLNLDVTINPDFSQVDVDEQVTNLTTYNVRFPEKRLFFLENSDVYEDFGIPPMRPFFSRRIGLDEDGNTIPILFGARLSGNINKNLRIGAMNMQTKEVELPGNNYTSLALHQRVFNRSVVKGYFHNRQAFTDGESQTNNYNRVGGLEYSYRSVDGRWQAFGGYGLAFTDSDNNENYFYNVAGGFDGRNISFYSNLAGVGDNYIADMGFIPRINHYDAIDDTTYIIGFNHSYTRLGYTIYPDNPKINQHRFDVNNIVDLTNSNDLISSEIRASYTIQLSNSSNFQVQGSHIDAQLLYPFGFTEDYTPLPSGKYHYNFGELTYQTDSRKQFSATTGVSYGEFYNGIRTQLLLNLKFRVQPWGNFGINFVQNNLDFPTPYGNETLFLVGPKTEFSFSRNLFWTTFLQYNTQNDNFNINSRFQWRYQPMSDLFIVYTDNYFVENWGPRNRALVLKLNYWFNL